jgi:hypothetical protein
MIDSNIIELFERVAELRELAEKRGFNELAQFLEAAANVAQDMAFQGYAISPQAVCLMH